MRRFLNYGVIGEMRQQRISVDQRMILLGLWKPSPFGEGFFVFF